MLSHLAEALAAGDVYRVAGEFRRRKLDIRLHYDYETVSKVIGATEEVSSRSLESVSLLEVQMTFEHEMTHWYQQIGTAYGCFQLSADDCSARQISGFLKDYRSIQPIAPFPRPIQSWVFNGWDRRRAAFRRHLDAGGNLASYLRRIKKGPMSSVLLAMLLNRAIELCEGGVNTSELITQFLYSQLWRALAANLEHIDPNVKSGLESLAAEEFSPAASARAGVPVVPGYGTIGAWHLIEGQAHFLELVKVSALIHQGRAPSVLKSYATDAGSRDYRVAFEYFEKRVRSRALSTTDVIMTFLCVCDLALSTPIHPVFYAIAPHLRWVDLHPGWRFVRLCEAVSESGTVGAETTSLDPDAYQRFVENICAKLSWSTPLQMANHFMNQTSVGLTDRLTTLLFASASVERMKNPTAFVLYLFDDAPRAESLMSSLPSPPIAVGDEDDPRFVLPDWGALGKDQRLSMMRDFVAINDAYRMVDSLLYDDSDLATLTDFWTGNADEVLQRNFGVAEGRFSAS